jgi:hypothetical protein
MILSVYPRIAPNAMHPSSDAITYYCSFFGLLTASSTLKIYNRSRTVQQVFCRQGSEVQTAHVQYVRPEKAPNGNVSASPGPGCTLYSGWVEISGVESGSPLLKNGIRSSGGWVPPPATLASMSTS